MNYVRRFILALIVLAFIICAWYGAEMLIHGESQRSVVDLFVAVVISLSISGNLEKGVEQGERKRADAEKFANEFVEYIKKKEESKNGKDGSREES